MNQHLHRDDLDRLRVGRLPAAEVLAIADHLAACDECRESCFSGPPTDDAAKRLLSILPDDAADHPDLDSLLFPYADGTLSAAARDEVEAHLAACAMCRADVDELRVTRVSRPGVRRGWMLTAAAAAVVALVAAALWMAMPRQDPIPATPPRAALAPAMPAAWRELLHSATASGRLDPPPVIAMLRPRAGVLRGAPAQSGASLQPSGVVVEGTRPRFSWGHAGNARFRVSVFDGDRLAAQSAVMPATAWQCDRDLPRGRNYSWQVEVIRGTSRRIIPAPGEPEAIFRILDEDSERDITSARQRLPADHLLAGVLYAHYGVRDRAEEELLLAEGTPAQAAAARRLLDSLRNWE
jgi:anti-sigma factor RsiW